MVMNTGERLVNTKMNLWEVDVSIKLKDGAALHCTIQCTGEVKSMVPRVLYEKGEVGS